MTAVVYTQAEVDALAARVLADAKAVDLTAAQVSTLITNALAALPQPTGSNVVVSRTAPTNAVDGTVWVVLP